MAWAIATLNDKSSDLDTKKRAVQTLIAKTQTHYDLNTQRLKDMGGKTVTVGSPDSAAASPAASAPAATMSEEDINTSLANAQAAVASGKWTKEQANAKLKAAGVPRGL